MKKVKYIAFRYLTNADFFNIYKPSGTEEGGGGQSYIDFKIGSISLEDWNDFFSGANDIDITNRMQGPCWNFTINSLSLGESQKLQIFQRRPQSIAVSSQKITSRRSNRVFAWHPENGFPEPENPLDRQSCPTSLAIYLVRTEDGEIWAGSFQNKSPCRDKGASNLLEEMLPISPSEGYAGFINVIDNELFIHESDKETPFFTIDETHIKKESIAKITKDKTKLAKKKPSKRPKTKRQARSEEEITKSLFEEDEEYDSELKAKNKEVIQRVRNRNTKAVKDLKELYKGKCQITGEEFIFLKKDGTPYCEAHHLIPLGEEGADSPYNIIIVNPLIHRMLHYAETSEIDIYNISSDNTLEITINKKPYTITWHKDHGDFVKKHQKISES